MAETAAKASIIRHHSGNCSGLGRRMYSLLWLCPPYRHSSALPLRDDARIRPARETELPQENGLYLSQNGCRVDRRTVQVGAVSAHARRSVKGLWAHIGYL